MTRVMLVEDLEDDIFIFKRALKRAGLDCFLEVCRDGAEAMTCLTQLRESPELWPAVMFLDLKMPRVDGLEVLEWMSAQEHLKGLRVVVLTSSDEPKDVLRTKQLGVVAYRCKPMSPDQLRNFVTG